MPSPCRHHCPLLVPTSLTLMHLVQGTLGSPSLHAWHPHKPGGSGSLTSSSSFRTCTTRARTLFAFFLCFCSSSRSLA